MDPIERGDGLPRSARWLAVVDGTWLGEGRAIRGLLGGRIAPTFGMGVRALGRQSASVALVAVALLGVSAGCLAPAGPRESVDGSGAVAPPATGTPIASDARGPSDAPPPSLSSGSPERPVASLPGGAVTLPPSGPPVTGEVPEAVLASIIEDAAHRTGADPATARIVRAEAVTWSDGSLGCPEPGMFYVQILIPGYWIIVEIGGETLDYRVGTHGAFRLCEQAAPGTP